MTLTRRQLAGVFAALYGAGGLLLLYDFVLAPTEAGAHLPLAWHVFPVSAAVSLLALLMDRSAPLDPVWYVPVAGVIAGYLLALALCTAALQIIVGGRAPAEKSGNGSDEPANNI